VAISDTAGVSARTKGVIGLFTRPNAYFLEEKGLTEDVEELASVFVRYSNAKEKFSFLHFPT
jgi:hypothetical protein